MLSRDVKFDLQNAKFGNVIPRKIIKFVVTRCQMLRLKCNKSVSDGFRGSTSKGKREGKVGKGGEKIGKGRKGRWRDR